MRELLLSGPGTGKTTRCIELFKSEILRSPGGIDSRSYFVLPSREHAERIQHLLLKKDVPGLFNAHILTLNDLAARLSGTARGGVLSDAARRRVIREILSSELTFPYFHDCRELAGFHEIVADLFKEFESSLLGIEEFERLAQPLVKDAVFRSKFRDLCVLYKNYLERLSAMGLESPESAIAEIAGGAAPPERCELVIFDGFYHFSRAQRALIAAVSRSASRVIVTLTGPADPAERPELFYHVGRTRRFLEGIGFKSVSAGAVNHRTASPALRHLERGLFAPSRPPSPPEPDAVTILEAPDAEGEIEMIARRIRALARSRAVYLSDIAVILRSVSPYQSLIERVFARFGIPVHVHERTALTDTVFGAYFYRLVRAVADPERSDDADALRRSSLASGIADPDAELARLRERSLGARDASSFCAAFFEHLRTLSMDAGEGERQALDAVRNTLETIRRGAARSKARRFDARAQLEELGTIAATGLLSLGPRGKNRVQVYDAVMALPKEYKAVFIAGLVEKQFPQAVSEEPLLKDAERAVLNARAEGEAVLEERRTRTAGERYFFYMAAARAREELYLSYPLFGADGRPLLASFFVEEARRAFDSPLRTLTRRPEQLLPEPADWETEGDLLRGLGRSLGLAQPCANALASLARSRAVAPSRLEAIDRYARVPETRAELTDARILERLSGLHEPYSPTRLESLAACAFRYFADQTLRLNEPPEDRDAAHMGTLLHEVLYEYYGSVPERSRRDGSHLTDTARMQRKLLALLKKKAPESPLAKGPAYRFGAQMARMRAALEDFAVQEKQLFLKRRAAPMYLEHDFGKTGGPASMLTLGQGKQGIRVRGQMDRVDVLPDGRALVVDYKLSRRDFAKKLEKGLELQLPLYLLAARRLLKLDVLGAEHRYLTDASKSGLYRDEARKPLALHGQTPTKEDGAFEAILSRAERDAVELAARHRGGDISVRSKSCEFCDHSPVCRFTEGKRRYV